MKVLIVALGDRRGKGMGLRRRARRKEEEEEEEERKAARPGPLFNLDVRGPQPPL